MDRILHELDVIRKRAYTSLIVQRLGWPIALGVLVLLLLTLADYFLHLPNAVRIIQLVGLAVAFGLAFRRWVLPALRLQASLVDIALRIERLLPELSGRLASAVEFSVAGLDQRSDLAARAVDEAVRRAGNQNLRTVARYRPTAISVSCAFLASLLIVILSLSAPVHASIAARRIFLPWVDAPWPRQTSVHNAMDAEVLPRGRMLSLRASVLRGFDSDMRVYANYRLQNEADDSFGAWRRVVLTYQRDNVFERLIEPADTGIADASAIEVWFEAGDDQTEITLIRLVPPPEVKSAVLHVTSPDYARQHIPDYEVDLTTEVGRTMVRRDPVLEGSRVELLIQLNKPVPCPNQSPTEETWKDVLGWHSSSVSYDMFRCYNGTPDASATPDASFLNTNHTQCDQWSITWHMTEPVMMYVTPVDEYGIAADDEFELFIPARADESPSVSIVDPVIDLEVLPTAVVPLRSEARDDVSVSSHQIVTRTESQSASDWFVLAEDHNDSSTQQVILEGTADFGSMSAVPGQGYEIRSRAEDFYITDDGRFKHKPVYSSPRNIRIITEAVFMERALNELNRVRNQAIRTSEQQQAIQTRLDAPAPDDESASQLATRLSNERLEQAAVGRQLARQRQALTTLQDRIDRNRLENPSLTTLVESAGQALDLAAQFSDSVDDAISQAIQSARTETPEDDVDIPQTIDEARQHERDVLNQLADIIEILDQGRDSWVARNQVAQLLARQQELAQQSREATAETRGQSAESLSPEQRAGLNELAAQQEELARDSEALIEQMRQQAREARAQQQQQQALAETLDRAANQAQTGQLTENMSEAADQLNRNQGERATNSQQSAIDTLQSMQNELEQLDRIRAEQLKRAVDDLTRAVEALVADQDAQLTALRRLIGREAAVDPQQYTACAEPLMTLYTNTLAVSEKAADTGSSMLEVASLLASAADPHQAEAITALRADEPKPQTAVSREASSLDLLKQALQRLQEAQQRLRNQENARKRAELVNVYRQLLGLQQTLTTDTQPISAQYTNAGNALDRRNQLTARRLADRQAGIRATAETLVEQTEGLAEALVFTATHTRIDQTAVRIVESLRQAQAPQSVIDRQRDIEHLLSAMITALGPASSNKEFQTDEAGQQAGGGGSSGSGSGQNQQEQLILPIAELRLIRELQASIHDSTQALGQSGATDTDRLSELGLAQQELAELTQGLLDKLTQQQLPQPPQPQQDEATPSPDYGRWLFFHQSQQPQQQQQQHDDPPPTTEQGDTTSNADQDDDDEPSLDELLNLDDPEKTDNANLPDVNKALEGNEQGSGQPNDPTQLFLEAQQAMQQSALLLIDQADPGLATQRLQQDALTRLDMLIALAESDQQQQQQQQQQPPGDSQQNSQTPPPSQTTPQNSQQSGAAENLGTDNRPGARDPREATGRINETRVEWGALPARVRRMLMQGRDETPAGIYRRLTELYYMRLAEEADNSQ